MPRRSQAPSPRTTSGRVNQKRRTRAAIVAAARAIYERGETPTIAQVAEEALMTRQTVYRYFPSQESLLLELTVSIDVAEIEAQVFGPAHDQDPRQRFVEFVGTFNRYCAENEGLYRMAQRHYLDLWLAAERSGEGHGEPLREGRRTAWIAKLLEPLRDALPDAERRRLEAALCLLVGGEAITVLADVCRMSGEEAVAVTRWAADVLLTEAFDRTAT